MLDFRLEAFTAGGFGLGMIYLPSIVIVGYYFESKRALATGIAVCGSGVGSIILPLLSNFILQGVQTLSDKSNLPILPIQSWSIYDS